MIKATRKPVKKKMIKRKPLMLNSKLKLPSKRGKEVPEALIRRPRIKIVFTTTRTTPAKQPEPEQSRQLQHCRA